MGGNSNLREPRKLKEAQLTPYDVRQIIMQRLPLHYRSSTKAFLSAKGGVNKRSNTIDFNALKLFLKNMNIVVPDETIQGLFKYLDKNGDGQVSCAEFIAAFGHSISGERADNIGCAKHLSFENPRKDVRVKVLPARHKWTYDEVKRVLADRLGLIHTSSTKAFMKAKGSNSETMSLPDLRRMLLNLNIDAPDNILQRMYREIDKVCKFRK